VVWLLLLGAAAARAEVGSAACRGCHQAQFESQSKSAHAASLARPSEHRLAPRFAPMLSFPADWAFGAGQQAVTFVSRRAGGDYIEHHSSFYPSPPRMAPTPGHAGKPGPGVLYPIVARDAAILRCFQCHSTGAVRVGGGLMIEVGEPGVRCEACHGPGEEHAKAPSRTNIGNPGRLGGGETNQLCGSCHRKPAAPGEPIDWTDPWNTRHQPLYLAESRCFQRSGDKLSCRTCHDAHSGATRPGCSDCHAQVRHKAPVAGTCASCHMPAVSPQPGLRFANHRIGVFAPGNRLRPRR
jgi:hypothetical protein